jgi:cardiolipin synthase
MTDRISRPPFFSRALFPLALVLLASQLLSCTTLPSLRLARELPLSRSGQVLSLEGPRGPVAPDRAARASASLGKLAEDTVLDRYLAMSEELIGEPLLIGNRVELLVDGPATYDALFAAIRAARDTVDIQAYIFEAVEHRGEALAELLRDRMAAGVRVRVLTDGVGSMASGPDLEALAEAGVITCIFNPLPRTFFRPDLLNHRDHRKITVIDGSDAFTGGINFSRVYRSGSAGFSRRRAPTLDEGWRDTHVRIQGPGARRLWELFEESWRKQDCPGSDAPVPARSVAAAGGTVVQIVPSSPDDPRNLTYLSVLGAVTYARKSVNVTMAYFVPDDQLEEALVDAARRGVEVRLILPAFSDFSGVFHAGRAHYDRLLAAGVKIHEQESAFLHAKTVVVDDIWSAIGSTNWDWRSFIHNDEVTVVIVDEGFGGRMMALFRRDLADSRAITLEEWRQRPWLFRAQERFWVMFQWLL